jgi:hypothetical protein
MKLEVNSKETANELESNISNNVVCIVLYHMNGCMYCETMIPEWYKFANKYESNKNIVIATIEREYLNLLNNKPDIMGYPTIYKYTNNNATVYNGKRNIKGFEGFSNIKATKTSTTKPKKQKSTTKPKKQKSTTKPKKQKSTTKPKKQKSTTKPKKQKSTTKPKKQKSTTKPKKQKSTTKPKKQ